MKNIPKAIYLQTGCEVCEDFKELSEVSWCSDRVYFSDIKYVEESAVLSFISRRIEAIDLEIKSTNDHTMSGGRKIQALRAAKKELKNLMQNI